MYDNEFKDDQNADDHEDEHVVLADLIANLKLDIDENKKIQKQLRNANTSLAQELKECKSTLEETNRTLGESNRTRDRCFVALHDKEIELAMYKTFKDHTIENDTLERKLNETQVALAQKEHDIKEGLKLKAYENSVVKEKHDELVKQILLTKSYYEGLVREKTKIPYDTSDLANRFIPDREETLTLEQESRSKLNKDLVKPYDYTKQNSLYETLNPRLRNIMFSWHMQMRFRAPTALDMEVLIKTCLIPLALKTQNDSFIFVHELKQEMHADLKYVESLEKEIDDLESDKAEFSNMYDLLLQECMSNDVLCSYLHSLSGLNAHTELQCLYLHKVKECECLAQKLSKKPETIYQMAQEKVSKVTTTNVFQKEHEQYHEIQDLKAQLQDQNIAISELKKLIEKMKVTPHSLPQDRKSSFAKPYDVNAPNPSRKSPKHVSFQSPKESVGSNDMVHNYYLEEAKKKAQLQKDKALNTKPSVQQFAKSPNTANGNKLKPRNFNQQPRNWPPSMSSCVSNRTVKMAEPPWNQKPFLKSKDLACPTCKKCIYSANHDECILKYLSKVNSRAPAQKKDAHSHKTTKRNIPVEKKSDSKKNDRHIPIGQKFSSNKSSAVYLKTTPPRSGLTWKLTGRIFT
ncbi:hypothetical protein Tco_1378830 [Tanacetum coccineum]